jgi:hypothetical protein
MATGNLRLLRRERCRMVLRLGHRDELHDTHGRRCQHGDTATAVPAVMAVEPVVAAHTTSAYPDGVARTIMG